MKDNTLLPCPFCGGDAKAEEIGLHYRVHCDSDCSGYRPYENAVNAWNTRAINKFSEYKKLFSFVRALASSECWSSLEVVENRAKEILREIGAE